MTPRRALRLALPVLIVIGVVIAIRQFDGGATVEREGLTFASPALASELEGEADSADVRIMAAFESGDGAPCRAFLGASVSGIACHERGGWHLRVIRRGVTLDNPAAVAATERALRQASGEVAAQ